MSEDDILNIYRHVNLKSGYFRHHRHHHYKYRTVIIKRILVGRDGIIESI
jgi:hypothetical protein